METTMHIQSQRLVAGLLISAGLVSTGLATSALAQGTMAQQDACRPDVFRLCSNYIPDVGQIVACLRDNEPRLSEACHDVMFEQRPAATEEYATRARARAEWAR
jgi:hypothetical protein